MLHDKIIDDLERRLEKYCEKTSREQNYVLFEELRGEYDVAGIRGPRVFVFEVKQHDNEKNRDKALMQLGKDFYYFNRYKRFGENNIKLFYAFSDEKSRRGYTVERIYTGDDR